MLNGEIVHVAEAQGGISAQVEYVEIDGTPFVLKTDSEFDVNGERLFQQELKAIGLAHIETYDHPDLLPNQMLMERVDAKSLNGPNFTNDNLTLLGQTLARIHSRTFDRFYMLDEHGQPQPTEWSQFVANLKNSASKTAANINGASEAVDLAAKRIEGQKIESFVLCHGDVHGNNILCSDEGLIPFDNNADSFVATPHYDLAVIFGEIMPGYRYGEENAQGTKDSERMEAFLKGYGSMPSDFEATIDDYVLLRLLTRYPNKFVPHLDSTIDLLISKQSG